MNVGTYTPAQQVQFAGKGKGKRIAKLVGSGLLVAASLVGFGKTMWTGSEYQLATQHCTIDHSEKDCQKARDIRDNSLENAGIGVASALGISGGGMLLSNELRKGKKKLAEEA